MLKSNLTHWYETLERGFHLRWMEALRHYGPETAHDLRVNLKRQDAFFHLLEALDARFSAGAAMEAYAGLYRKAGRVRNYQVERDLIMRQGILHHWVHLFVAWLAEKEERRARLLQQYEKAHSMQPIRELAAQVYMHIRHLPEAGLEVSLRQYLVKLVRGILGFISQSRVLDEDLHDLRKLIKELFYNLEFLAFHLGREQIQCQAIVLLDELQHELGKWHDCDFTLVHLARKAPRVLGNTVMAQIDYQRQAYKARAYRLFPRLVVALPELEDVITRAL